MTSVREVVFWFRERSPTEEHATKPDGQLNSLGIVWRVIDFSSIDGGRS